MSKCVLFFYTFKWLKYFLIYILYFFQDRSGFLGAGSAFSDLYSGVSSSTRPQDSLQDVSRNNRDDSSDIKRTHGKSYILFLLQIKT